LEPIVKQAYQDAKNTATQPGPEIPISIHEAAALVNKKVSTLYIFHSRGLIPADVCVKHGRRLYFYKSALLNWIKQGNESPV
jgi:predicted DNA-binding transcriptional regulator AlpA